MTSIPQTPLVQLFGACSVIDKINVVDRQDVDESEYDVLDNAVTCILTRLEADLRGREELGVGGKQRFMIITDKGRVAPMTRVSRRRQVYNPTRPHSGGAYQFLIKRLLEDPLPKESDNSFFIQLTDLMATITLLYIRNETDRDWSRQLPYQLEPMDVRRWMDELRGVLNLEASKDSAYGVLYYPEKEAPD